MLQDITTDIYGSEIAFDGNPNLKRSGTKLGYTKEHIEEYLKCAKDVFYFAENYYKILSLTDGMITPKLRDYQHDMIKSYIDNRFSLILATRQAGKSTSFEIFLCWTILFQKDQRIAILANKAEQSRDILRKVKEAYELLPKFLQQGVKVWNAGSIKLENGSMIIASSTSSTAIRGRSIGILVVDERAFIPNKLWDTFISSVYPTISSSKTSKVIYVSTFNGLNHFYKDWCDALDGKNAFYPIRVDWWQVPGRDEAWKEETIRNIGLTRFRQEYGNEAFGSIATLVDPEYVKELKHKAPLTDPKMPLTTQKWAKYFNFFEEPIKGHQYVLGVDSAKMTEENAGDALGMQVLDVTSWPFKQVATFFAKDSISYLQVPEIACDLGNYYNEAYMFIENNEIGQEVANMVQFDYEYENLYFEKGNLPGYRTTKKTKRIGLTNLKVLLENNKLILNDFDTISQISTFIRVKDSYRAESGYMDDLVMALVGALFFIQANGLDINSVEDNSKVIKNIFQQGVVEEDVESEISVLLIPDSYEGEEKRDADGFLF